MIRFLADTVAECGESAKSSHESKRQALEEVNKAFNSFFGTIPEEHKARMLGILLPTFVLLLVGSEDSTSMAAHYHSLGIQTLLQLATAAPRAFKEAAGSLEQQQKTALETALRETLAGGATSTASKAAKPTIELRSF